MYQLSLLLFFCIYCFILFYFGIRLLYSRKRRLAERLNMIENLGNAFLEEDRESRRVESKGKKAGRFKFLNISEQLKMDLKGAGVSITAEEYMILWFCCALVPPLLGLYITGQFSVMVILLLVGAGGPPLLIRIARKNRMKKFSTQLGDALSMIGNCLRSGFSFRQSMERISIDMPDPIASEFQNAVSLLNYGATLTFAMEEMGNRMENEEIRLINSALVIQQRVGGNLSDIIDNVAATIKDRIQVRQTLSVLTAQGRVSGLVLGVLPILVLIGMSFMNPEYMGIFFSTTIGHVMLIAASIWEGLGFIFIYKIINIKVD